MDNMKCTVKRCPYSSTLAPSGSGCSLWDERIDRCGLRIAWEAMVDALESLACQKYDGQMYVCREYLKIDKALALAKGGEYDNTIDRREAGEA